MFRIQKTNDVITNGVKILVYGAFGSGKTTLIGTLPAPVLIISNESGLLPLRHLEIDYIEVKNLQELTGAYTYALEHLSEYRSIAIDSATEIAEVVLAAEKTKNPKDGRQAYQAMGESVLALFRSFRDLEGVNVYLTASLDRMQDDTGKILYGPSMPGQKVAGKLPGFYDEVFCLHALKDEKGEPLHVLQTHADERFMAKDRSGVLDLVEAPDLGKVIRKITGKGENT